MGKQGKLKVFLLKDIDAAFVSGHRRRTTVQCGLTSALDSAIHHRCHAEPCKLFWRPTPLVSGILRCQLWTQPLVASSSATFARQVCPGGGRAHIAVKDGWDGRADPGDEAICGVRRQPLSTGVGSSGAAWLQLKFGDGKGQHEMDLCEWMSGQSPKKRKLSSHDLVEDKCSSYISGEFGAVAIYDATNSTKERRRWLVERLQDLGAKVIFLEVTCSDSERISENIQSTHKSLQVQQVLSAEEAGADFMKRIGFYNEVYETLQSCTQDSKTSKPPKNTGQRLSETEYSWIKFVDGGREISLHNMRGFLASRIAQFLLNLHGQRRPIFLSRHGQSEYNRLGKIGGDSEYATALADWVDKEVKIDATGKPRPARLWTSSLKRTRLTARHIRHDSLTLPSGTQWVQMRPKMFRNLDEIYAGLCDGMTYEDIEREYPEEATARKGDKFEYRYPRGESYTDLISRLEPMAHEMERAQETLLVVAHQAILRAAVRSGLPCCRTSRERSLILRVIDLPRKRSHFRAEPVPFELSSGFSGSFMFCGRFDTFKTSTATSDAIDSFAPCGLASPQSLQKLQNKELAGSEVTWQGQLSCSPCTTSSSGDRCLLADTAPVYVYVLSQHPQRLDDAGNSHSATCLQKARAMLETCCGQKWQDLVWLGQGRKSRGEVQFTVPIQNEHKRLAGLKAWAPNPEEALFEYNEIFCSRCYGPSPLQAPEWAGLPLARLQEDRSQPFVVVDAGMNLGVFELHLQRLATRPVTSLAFEPAPEVFQLAVRSCREAGIDIIEHYELPAEPLQLRGEPGLQVHAFQMALSDAPGTLSFTHFPDSPANSALSRHLPKQRWLEGYVPASVELEVPCCRLSQALEALDSPAGATVFLKGDVEGAEVDLLRGLDDEHWAWVCGLAIEAAETKDELMELCKKHGLGDKLLALKQPSPEGDTSRTDTEVLHMVFAASEQKRSRVVQHCQVQPICWEHPRQDHLLLPSPYHPTERVRSLPTGLAVVIGFGLSALKCCGEDAYKDSEEGPGETAGYVSDGQLKTLLQEMVKRLAMLHSKHVAPEELALEACELVASMRKNLHQPLHYLLQDDLFLCNFTRILVELAENTDQFAGLWEDVRCRKQAIADCAGNCDEQLMTLAQQTHFSLEDLWCLCITWVLETIFAELAPKVGRLTFMELACGMSALALGTMDEKLQVCFDLFDSEGRRALTLKDLNDLCTTLFKVALSHGSVNRKASTDEVMAMQSGALSQRSSETDLPFPMTPPMRPSSVIVVGREKVRASAPAEITKSITMDDQDRTSLQLLTAEMAEDCRSSRHGLLQCGTHGASAALPFLLVPSKTARADARLYVREYNAWLETAGPLREGSPHEEGSSLGHLIHRFFASFLVRPFHSITRQVPAKPRSVSLRRACPAPPWTRRIYATARWPK
eukprot:s3526_g5.t1